MVCWDDEDFNKYYQSYRFCFCYDSEVDGDRLTVYEDDKALELLKVVITRYFELDVNDEDYNEKLEELVGETYCRDYIFYCPSCNEDHYLKDYGGDYLLHDGEFVCGDCIRKDPDWYIEHIKNDYNNANNFLNTDVLVEKGYRKIDEGDVGMYQYNTNVYPIDYYKKYEDSYDVIFSITSGSNPFQTEFDVWVKEK